MSNNYTLPLDNIGSSTRRWSGVYRYTILKYGLSADWMDGWTGSTQSTHYAELCCLCSLQLQ